MSDTDDTSRLIRSIRDRVCEYLQGEAGVTVQGTEVQVRDVMRLQLRPLTSVLGIEGDQRLLVAFSFDLPLIERVFTAYADGIEIEEDEREDMVAAAAAEVINIIVGNAMADIQVQGEAISISPPVVMGDAKNITRHRGACFSTVDVATSEGGMSIHFVGPKALFDQHLNYTK